MEKNRDMTTDNEARPTKRLAIPNIRSFHASPLVSMSEYYHEERNYIHHARIQEFSPGGGGPGQSDKKALTFFFFFF